MTGDESSFDKRGSADRKFDGAGHEFRAVGEDDHVVLSAETAPVVSFGGMGFEEI